MKDKLQKWYMELLDKQTLTDMEYETGIIKMTNNIQKYGHKNMWKYIEKVENCKLRTLMRGYFFEAGGIIPLED